MLSPFFCARHKKSLKKVGDGTALLMLLHVKEMEARHLLMCCPSSKRSFQTILHCHLTNVPVTLNE